MKKAKRLSQAAVEKAYQKLRERDSQGAHSLASRAAWLDPQNEDAWLILAATGTQEKSLKFIKKALQINPNSASAQAGLEWASKRKTKSQKAKSLAVVKRELNPRRDNPGCQSANQKNKRHWQRATTRWQSVLSIVTIFFIIVVAIMAPLIAPVDESADAPYYKIACEKFRCVPEAPSAAFPLGTIKEFDVLHTLVWGVRQALIFGLTAAGLTALFGITSGAIAAYSGGWIDSLIMRVCDGFLAFPIIAAVAMFSQVIAYLAPESWGLTLTQFEAIPEKLNIFQSFIIQSDPVLLALILFSWMPYTRVMHAQVLQAKKTEYVDAARLLGARKSRIILRHILPNSISPAIVMLTRDIGRMVVLQASLTFIGVSDSSPWASLLTLGKDWIIGPGGNLFTRWWIYLPITLAIVFFGVSWNLLGDEMNLWLNPRETLFISRKEYLIE